ncbi:electron transfer flavoprotein subunit beta [Jiella sonneratiae]|uniref:Electron transfer flavoprotein subunit beta n=1 Tax=Jiella sonneratiae TaxID=2816856 RepID=A0ABS3J834_9HYPH|nr:electron transfer flavoprotein subunit beta [Jiella sonneratiae]MBO0905829.1 electron transfer flavoprotein subunit beta [Jiella sonneratiae]
MKTVVLLSDARHAISGRATLSGLEARAISLAAALDPAPRGLHAGGGAEGVSAGLGHGLQGLDVLDLPEGADPVPALAAHLQAALGKNDAPGIVLAGRRGEGGLETGLVPYLLADALGLPILADAVALRQGEAAGTLVVDQAMQKGARRRVTIRLPAVVTVHPLAPPPRPFAYAKMRRGEIRFLPTAEAIGDTAGGGNGSGSGEERPHRARPKLMRTGGTAAGAHNLHVGPEPEEAARLILDYLEANGIRRYGDTRG